MALEAVVYPQIPFSYIANKDLYNMFYDGLLGLDHQEYHHHDHHQEHNSLDFLGNQTESPTYYGDNNPSTTHWNPSPASMLPHFDELHLSGGAPSPPDAAAAVSGSIGSSPAACELQFPLDAAAAAAGEFQAYAAVGSGTRPKRRRSRSRKNKEDIENQRMTHIAVERNRRKQMNDYLSVLRSLMPESYVQRGDQASIIGGAINFVKELEQQVQFLGVRKEARNKGSDDGAASSDHAAPFSEFFTFPQYSTTGGGSSPGGTGESQPGVADVEVTMVESHANLKIRSKRRPRQLLKVVSGLQSMRLTILHLNVTTEEEIVLYSLSVKVEDDCKLTAVDEIATAVYQILARIQEETELIMSN